MHITKKEYDTPILITVLGLVMVGMSIYVYTKGKDIIESTIIDNTTMQANTVGVPSTMELSIYVQDKEQARINDCGITKKETYTVPKTKAVADTSLKILFEKELSQYGIYKSVTISKGVAKVMLANNTTPSGSPLSSLSSCQVGHLMSVLEDTLTQYESIKSVEIFTPEGKAEF